MQSLTLYRIDEWDGGDRHHPTKFHFHDETVAEEAKGKHDLVSRVQIIICNSADDMGAAHKLEVAQSALSRLSKTEREALGMPGDLNLAMQEVAKKYRGYHPSDLLSGPLVEWAEDLVYGPKGDQGPEDQKPE